MANIARDRSTDPEVRQLAFDIASTQLEQVGRMKGWLMMWNEHEQNVSGVYMACLWDMLRNFTRKLWLIRAVGAVLLACFAILIVLDLILGGTEADKRGIRML